MNTSQSASSPAPTHPLPGIDGPSSSAPEAQTVPAAQAARNERNLPPRASGAPLPAAAEVASRRSPRSLRFALAAAVLVAIASGAAWYAWKQGAGRFLGASAPAPVPAASGVPLPRVLAKNVVATIDGRQVLEGELSSMLSTGADRAVAIDRYINKVLAAEAARARYADDARALSTAAEREVLANLFLQRRSQELLQAVTDEQVADYYKANVRDEDYAAYKLRYYLTRDQADATNVRGLIDKGDRAAAARLAPLGSAADGFLPFQGIPYGLGQVVRRAKVGEVIGPVTVRDGLLVLVLDEVRAGKKPELPAVQAEIRALLADRQLTEELLGLRKKASIQLN
jgi:parvulin-like peptidyl-prolyl isomerase